MKTENLFLTNEEIFMLKRLNEVSSWGCLSHEEEFVIDSLEDKGLAYRTSDSCAYGLFTDGVKLLEGIKRWE